MRLGIGCDGFLGELWELCVSLDLLKIDVDDLDIDRTPRTHFVLSISATFRHLRGIRAARHPTFELRDGSFPENLYRVNFNERSRDSWIDSGDFFFQLTLVFYCSNIYVIKMSSIWTW